MSETEKALHPFFVDAKRYETAKTALTGAEIKALAVVAANYQLFLEEEGDTPDKGIGDGEAVSVTERVQALLRRSPSNVRAPMISEQFIELQDYLREYKHQNAEIMRRADGSYLITVSDVGLPAGWSQPKVDVFFIAPPGYPAAKPDCFWVAPPVRLISGAIPQNANDGTPLPYDTAPVRALTWFSWHLQVWDPNHSSLATFFRAIAQRLNPAR